MRRKLNGKTIETSFGQITVFNNEKPERKTQPPNEKISKKDEKQPAAVVAQDENKNEDFLGLDTQTFNYFDQQLVKSYDSSLSSKTIENITSPQKIGSPKAESFQEPLDFVDNQYFGALDPSIQATETTKKSPKLEKHVTKSDVEKVFSKDANYFDKQLLELKKNAKYDSDDIGSIGSVRDFKKGREKKQVRNKPVESIPLVQTTNLTEENLRKGSIKFQNVKKEGDKNKTDSHHKELLTQVPDWSRLTKDEAIKILVNHVCYHNAEEGLFGLDKPYGLPSKRGPGVHLCVASLLPDLEKSLNLNCRLLMCNRLDENTTGVMLFAMNSETAAKIRKYYDEKKVIKQYLTITKDIPKFPDGEINIPLIRRSINGKYKTYLSPDYNDIQDLMKKPPKDNEKRRYAVTKYRILDSYQKAALLEIQPQTGFTHQIRSHLSYGIGCPILGDHKYSHHVKMAPQRLPDEILKLLEIRQSKARYVPMHLHSYRIILPEFVNNSNVFIQAKLPIHFLNTLRKLKLKF